MSLNPLRKLFVPESTTGVCLWEIDGGYIADADKNYLSLEGVVGDKRVEAKMREAALYWLGKEGGKPKWVYGARQISYDEWEDQKERMIEGKIPDEVEEVQQAMRVKK